MCHQYSGAAENKPLKPTGEFEKSAIVIKENST